MHGQVIRCSGEFRLEVVGKGSVNLDFVFLQPGEWGRFQGLSVLKSGADLLLEMGIKAVRVVRSTRPPMMILQNSPEPSCGS